MVARFVTALYFEIIHAPLVFMCKYTDFKNKAIKIKIGVEAHVKIFDTNITGYMISCQIQLIHMYIHSDLHVGS